MHISEWCHSDSPHRMSAEDLDSEHDMRLKVAAAFARGAVAAVLSTCLAATKEGTSSEEKKQRYLPAKAADTHRTRKRGRDLGAVPPYAGIDGRVTGNTFSKSHGPVAPAEVGQVSPLAFPVMA